MSELRIKRSILIVRGQRVMLDRDLASLYQVPTKALNQAVKRHLNRFPSDFMFQLTEAETRNWISHAVISNPALKMGLRWRPYAFTEQGVAILSSVLNSERAVEVNIQIIRTFVRLRALVAAHADLAKRLDELEGRYDSQFKVVFDAIRRLMIAPEPRRKRIGFKVDSMRSNGP